MVGRKVIVFRIGYGASLSRNFFPGSLVNDDADRRIHSRLKRFQRRQANLAKHRSDGGGGLHHTTHCCFGLKLKK